VFGAAPFRGRTKISRSIPSYVGDVKTEKQSEKQSPASGGCVQSRVSGITTKGLLPSACFAGCTSRCCERLWPHIDHHAGPA